MNPENTFNLPKFFCAEILSKHQKDYKTALSSNYHKKYVSLILSA